MCFVYYFEYFSGIRLAVPEPERIFSEDVSVSFELVFSEEVLSPEVTVSFEVSSLEDTSFEEFLSEDVTFEETELLFFDCDDSGFEDATGFILVLTILILL